MGAVCIVAVQPVGQLLVALSAVLVAVSVGPLAKRGLDEALGLAIGSGRVWPGESVFDTELLASITHCVVNVVGNLEVGSHL